MFIIRYFFVIQVLDLVTYVAVSAQFTEGTQNMLHIIFNLLR